MSSLPSFVPCNGVPRLYFTVMAVVGTDSVTGTELRIGCNGGIRMCPLEAEGSVVSLWLFSCWPQRDVLTRKPGAYQRAPNGALHLNCYLSM